ncbi:hypothetical protein F4805DRAFT_425063 [Annulohypoxylon moriforme]|nr:hypothetical protein F4805DRAFT_425063 [Annulohypoxylon moriforme]
MEHALLEEALSAPPQCFHLIKSYVADLEAMFQLPQSSDIITDTSLDNPSEIYNVNLNMMKSRSSYIVFFEKERATQAISTLSFEDVKIDGIDGIPALNIAGLFHHHGTDRIFAFCDILTNDGKGLRAKALTYIPTPLIQSFMGKNGITFNHTKYPLVV